MKKIIFSDFDGTLTVKNKLGAIFFDILRLLEEKNYELVIVSGRSFSWGNFLVTHFPVHAAIMEGGGVIVNYSDKHEIEKDILVEEKDLKHLEKSLMLLLNTFPDLAATEDSFGRITDRAISLDFFNSNIDGVNLKKEVEQFFDQEKINYSTSSIHLNFWSGAISKINGIREYLKRYRPGIKIEDCLYFGDAPNDEDVFEHLEHSIGVSNINNYLDKLKHHPKIILEGEENRGPYGVYNYLKDYLK